MTPHLDCYNAKNYLCAYSPMEAPTKEPTVTCYTSTIPNLSEVVDLNKGGGFGAYFTESRERSSLLAYAPSSVQRQN
ncbi:hypothetical protein ACN38_g12868 [Penicillium nordicum]|uniref:Uncharacterized protein n=1 Tax=Penicillium nordicum TaxID=229535 RepID=A0A0M9W9K4_9EURO|nr:hypothetical protein ACN38_g12868 [Penicillium nordicum]